MLYKSYRKHKYAMGRQKTDVFLTVLWGSCGERRKANPPLIYSFILSGVPQGSGIHFQNSCGCRSSGAAPLKINVIHADGDGTKPTARPKPGLNLDKAFGSCASPMEGMKPNAVAAWTGRKSFLQLFCRGIQPRS